MRNMGSLPRKCTARWRQEAKFHQSTSVSVEAKSVTEREAAVSAGEQKATRRDKLADQREVDANLRETALSAQEEAASKNKELRAKNEAQLREANESLILATVRAQADTEAAQLATAQMSFIAEHDILTGLSNRSILADRLTQAIALARRNGKRVALMYLDLDHFKHINDLLGHAAGDLLLQSATKRLQACIRLSDTLSRQGGDEFVMLLPDIGTKNDAVLAAKKLIEAMAPPHFIGGHQVCTTLSIGISLFPEDGQDAETIIRNADNAMYYAKRNGRNRYKVFTPDMNACTVARHSIVTAMHHALEHQEFVIHYQPTVNLANGALIGAEALIRLNLPEGLLIYPAHFLSIAEDCGLILPIGSWVINEVCHQVQGWLKAGLCLGFVSVNISAKEFHSKGFFPIVRAALQDTGLDPCHLELELAENVLMQDLELTLELLRALKALGVRIAIDDFGTGYSSLSYLHRFPLDTLKIGRSSVHALGTDPGKAVIRTLIALGLHLNLRVTAVGIETQQEWAYLKSNHCTGGQGYYFEQPINGEKFTKTLAAGRN